MLNRYPLWKYLLVLLIVLGGALYAAPNLYAPDPALQIAGESSATQIDEATLNRAIDALDLADIEHFGEELSPDGRSALVRLEDQEEQLRAQALVSRALGDGYIIALNLAETTPDWLTGLGGQPMKLGLDLSGGVHFKLEVDVDAAVERRMDYYLNATKRALREERIRGFVGLEEARTVVGRFRSEGLREQAREQISDAFPELLLDRVDGEDEWVIRASMTDPTVDEIIDYSVSQNLTTLRNRVNELGVSEPLVQRQGRTRIVVELPGIQDTAEAKRILGKVANLEFRLVAAPDADASDRQRFEYRSEDRAGLTEYLERSVIITGEHVS
ncbi:MAG: protein translocase subunit SecD, partial [Pseudomonadota bacterium]